MATQEDRPLHNKHSIISLRHTIKFDKTKLTPSLIPRKSDEDDTLRQAIKELGPKTEELHLRLEEEGGRFEEDSEEAQRLKRDLKVLEEECVRLKAKLKYLNENFSFQEILGGVNIDDLKSTVTNNLVVNDTINNLLSRWDNIKKFGSNQD